MKARAKQEATPLGGMIVAAPTPRRAEEYSIDLGATLEMIDFLCQSGVQAITLLGSTGEFVHFALDDRRHMVKFAVKRSRLPLLAERLTLPLWMGRSSWPGRRPAPGWRESC